MGNSSIRPAADRANQRNPFRFGLETRGQAEAARLREAAMHEWHTCKRFSDERAMRTLDHAFCSSGWQVQSCRVMQTKHWPSDHLPIVACLRLSSDAPPRKRHTETTDSSRRPRAAARAHRILSRVALLRISLRAPRSSFRATRGVVIIH